MAFNGTEGNPIDPEKAGEWTRNYRQVEPGGIHAHFFGRDILLNLLGQAGAQGIRFYYGLDGQTPQLIAVAADTAENDQLGEYFIVANKTLPHPPNASQPNILNS